MTFFKTHFIVLAFLAFIEFPLCCLATHSTTHPENVAKFKGGAHRLASLCPLGDHVHVQVYDFIVASLKRSEMTREQTLEIVKTEEANATSGEIYKPYLASVQESQLSHILGALCKADKRCVSVSLFDKAGLLQAVGLSALELSPSDQIYIEDPVFEAYQAKTQKRPLRTPLSNNVSFVHGGLRPAYEMITYPVFWDSQSDIASLYSTQDSEELIGFVVLIRQEA